ncbi:GNAT family N-acetyltransferase [Pedobacter immunditicola]|uniref:GNAT family N-acetyltransferase n=1 Tax=Pedobacter immunditicola TaxID=3133440 RepID=UPI00309FF3FB
MIKATYADKSLVLDILTKSFEKNKSVNYVIRQNHKKFMRIYELMDYSFEQCYLFGEIYLSDDRNACALILYPHQKITTLKTIKLEFKRLFHTISLKNISKTLKRESKIKHIQPKTNMLYLWFIGVEPKFQHTGLGTKLLKELLDYAQLQQLPVYLETSTIQNLPWYKKHGFQLYHQLDLSYKLHFLKKVPVA